jgi:hypothetical protein
MGDNDEQTGYNNYVSSTVAAERKMFIITISYLIISVLLLGPLGRHQSRLAVILLDMR